MTQINSFIGFLTKEGRREEAKMDELLDIKRKRPLTADEYELLVSLSKGASLPEEERPTLKTHKTGGGYILDDEGGVMTEEEDEIKPGKEFTTQKGRLRSADKVSTEEIIDARVYRNKDSEVRFIFAYITLETGTGVTHDWIIYKTDGGEFGSIMNTNIERFRYYKTTTPEILWSQKDHQYDYGMILDQDLYEDFINMIELIKENQKRNREILGRLYNRFRNLL